MNFLDHTLPDAAQHYLDALAHLSVKQAEQNDVIEKIKANNLWLTSQFGVLTTHSAEQSNLIKKSLTVMDTLVNRLAVLEGQRGTEQALKKMAAAPAAMFPFTDTDKGQQQKKETLMANRYRDNGDGTVTDVSTGLQWMRFSLGQYWQAGDCVGKANSYTWNAALAAAETFNRQNGYAGRRDWRLPTKQELLSLIYCSSGKPKTWNDSGNWCEGNYEKPTIFQPAFPNTPSSSFWSGSTNANNPSVAWFVNFGFGNANADNKTSSYYVRLVRSGQ